MSLHLAFLPLPKPNPLQFSTATFSAQRNSTAARRLDIDALRLERDRPGNRRDRDLIGHHEAGARDRPKRYLNTCAARQGFCFVIGAIAGDWPVLHTAYDDLALAAWLLAAQVEFKIEALPSIKDRDLAPARALAVGARQRKDGAEWVEHTF